MAKSKQTKKMLFSSVIALILCFSMLLGTTFAWFTDSVTSANNIIQSGNLDIKLEYWDGDSWEDVSGKSDILTNTLWEPGVTEVAYLRVANAGSLALKYQLGINIISEIAGVNVAGDVFKLSDYIQFGVVENVNGETGAYATREAAVAAVTGAEKISAGYTKASSMDADEELYLALVVWMPTSVDNAANHNGVAVPQIDLGLKLIATQKDAEDDSFGTDYDEDAWHPEMKVYNAQDLQAAINNGETNIVLMDDIVLTDSIVIPAPAVTTYSMRSVTNAVTIDLNGRSITADNTTYAITNLGNLILMDSVGTGSVNARGIYNGSETVTNAHIIVLSGNYNALGTDGGSAIYNYGVADIKGGKFTSVGGYGLNNQTGANMTVSDASVTGGIYNLGSLVLNNTDVYQHISGRHAVYNWAGTVEINGGVFDSISGNELILADGQNASVVINGGTFNKTAKSWLFGAATGKNITFTINNGVFNGYVNLPENTVDTIRPYGDPIVVNGGTFNFNPTQWVADGFKAVETEAGWMVISTNQNYVADGVLVSTDGNTYCISNAAGYAWMDAQSDAFFAGKTVKLTASIDFGGETINSIRFWNSENRTIFDGQGNSLSNFVISNDSNAGLFNGTLDVKNLIVENATVTGKYVGVIAGNMYGNIDNCIVKNSVVNGTYWQTGALAGQYNAGNVTNCVVEDCTINGLSAVGGLVGILNETAGVRKIENCVVRSTTINQIGSFGGDYDNYFGVAVGLINIDNSTVYVNNCTFEDNTLKGVASRTVYGEAESSTRVIVDGATYVMNATELQNAITNGYTSIAFGADIAGDVTVSQPTDKDVNVTIDGNGYKYDGQITVWGNSNYGADTLTIKNVNFETATKDRIFVWSYDQNAPIRYAHNVTVENCTFTATGDAVNTAAGVKVLQAYNIKVVNCTATNMHSLIQAESCGETVTVDGCKVINCKNGVSFNNTKNAVIKNTSIESVAEGGYGIRVKGSENGYGLTVEKCTVKAWIPVLVRNMTGPAYTATFSGTNTLTATNADGYQIAFTNGDWDGTAAPAAPTGTYTLTGADNFKVFGK